MKMIVLQTVTRHVKAELWWTVCVIVLVTMVANVTSLSGPNVCMVKQKYNITKRVKYRAPMSVRTYEWCFAMPPRCSKWSTEMRDVTRLETEERTAEMAACCPGFKLKGVLCMPTCPYGKTGQSCSEDCPPNKWGPSCAHDCKKCAHGSCDPMTGECRCQDGWQGESCVTSMTTTTAAAMMEQLLTTEPALTKITQTTQTVTARNSPVTSIPTSTARASTYTAKITPTTPTILPSTEFMRTTVSPIPTTITTFPTTRKEQELTPKTSVTFNNVTMPTSPMTSLNIYTIITDEQKSDRSTDIKSTVSEEFMKNTKTFVDYSNYNRTELPKETVNTKPVVNIETTTEPTSKTVNDETTIASTMMGANTKATIQSTKTSTALSELSTTVKAETRKPSTTVRLPMTTKSRPKEIWIKPTQKGESAITETKIKSTHDLPYTKFKHKDVIEITTPKTIIVSIIPTSVTYVTFKKIALTTTSSIAHKNNISTANSKYRATVQEFTKPMVAMTTTSKPFTVKDIQVIPNASSTINPVLHQNTHSYTSTTRKNFKTAMPTKQTTNSMSSTMNVANKRLNSSLLTTYLSFSTNVTRPIRKQHSLSEMSTSKTFVSNPSTHKMLSTITEKSTAEYIKTIKQPDTVTQKNLTSHVTDIPEVTRSVIHQANINKKNITSANTTSAVTVTDNPTKNEETFHILTEPEHITAVMGDKDSDRSTVSLVSIISIAGGVMMALITVAVVIVMLDRCRKPRYEDVRKYNDIKMQVMIDNNDVPPPYVRSIFHTPLPDPPTSEKCHYQPISTLDRNLKQFMRPVVVQTISPLMLENFRGILECHYDHLPRRSQDIGMQTRCSVAPSIDERDELLPPPRVHSLTDSDIEAMKCEAKLDVIDNTTSEPLYAEIPCWRPPSAHAIEVVNLNGESVTEL